MHSQHAAQVNPVKSTVSRRGANNALRRGQQKIHRRYTPNLCCRVPKGMASKVVARMSSHDWRRNDDLIGLRRQGYIPYTQRNNPDYRPKPMRIAARSESREALTVLSMVLGANCDYNPDSDYPFEIMLPFEDVAKAMGCCTYTKAAARRMTWRCMRCRCSSSWTTSSCRAGRILTPVRTSHCASG
ncbi:Uncharacterised protein [Klebsiella pneumoniae]|nr:Uncharacterised protein [Klebsiella pneumoniae]